MGTLLERLGFAPDRRVVIVTCNDLGFSYAANGAIYDALRDGGASSASLMIPAPWARGAAAAYRGEDVGVHLTLNAELDLYRWGPITHAPSLLDGDGGFPRTITDIWEHADLDEVRREWRAQIERAIYWGFDVSHLDAHLEGVELKPEFCDVYLDLADEFRLPVRLPGAEDQRRIGFPIRHLAEERGVVSPDRLVELSSLGKTPKELVALLSLQPPGVVEISAHPALDTAELRASVPDWSNRVEQAGMLMKSGALAEALQDGGFALLGYRELRALMR